MALYLERRSTGQELPVQSLLFWTVLFYADLNGGGRRFYLKPAAAIMSARRAERRLHGIS